MTSSFTNDTGNQEALGEKGSASGQRHSVPSVISPLVSGCSSNTEKLAPRAETIAEVEDCLKSSISPGSSLTPITTSSCTNDIENQNVLGEQA